MLTDDCTIDPSLLQVPIEYRIINTTCDNFIGEIVIFNKKTNRTTPKGRKIYSKEERKNIDFPYSPETDL